MLYRILIYIVLFLIGICISCCLIRKRKNKVLDLKDPELNEIANKMRCGISVNIEDAFRVLDAIEHAKKDKKKK